jgi:hypothetical protein
MFVAAAGTGMGLHGGDSRPGNHLYPCVDSAAFRVPCGPVAAAAGDAGQLWLSGRLHDQHRALYLSSSKSLRTHKHWTCVSDFDHPQARGPVLVILNMLFAQP